jgi:hypothetical protein
LSKLKPTLGCTADEEEEDEEWIRKIYILIHLVIFSSPNLDNLKNARQEASRHFRNKKREYLKAKINELVRIRISENCIEESMTLRRVTSLELT